MKAYAQADRDAAVLALAMGRPLKTLARELGISETTLRRWRNPEFDEKSRVASRTRKQTGTYRGSCVDCGAETSYSGHGTRVSLRCQPCRQAYVKAELKVWTEAAVIDAIQRFAEMHGRPPLATEWIRGDNVNRFPPRSSVYGQWRSTTPFPTWSAAIRAAGFEPHKPGRNTLERHDSPGWNGEGAVSSAAPSHDAPEHGGRPSRRRERRQGGRAATTLSSVTANP